MTTQAGETTRRTLRFATIDEALAEAQHLVAAERDGRLNRCGNWTLGQTLGHLATWASFAHGSYPPEVRPPLPVRFVLRMFRRKIIHGAMMPGIKMRGIPGGTVGTDDMPADEGLRRLRDAFGRLAASAPTQPNPVFGNLTHEEWIALNLRHAELHLGHHVPQ